MINSRDLRDLRGDVAANCRTLLELCKQQGLDVLIAQTKRDNEYQATLYAQGRTKPGSIVTNSPTVTFHGAGLAFDFCKNVKGHEYDDPAFFADVAAIAIGMDKDSSAPEESPAVSESVTEHPGNDYASKYKYIS